MFKKSVIALLLLGGCLQESHAQGCLDDQELLRAPAYKNGYSSVWRRGDTAYEISREMQPAWQEVKRLFVTLTEDDRLYLDMEKADSLQQVILYGYFFEKKKELGVLEKVLKAKNLNNLVFMSGAVYNGDFQPGEYGPEPAYLRISQLLVQSGIKHLYVFDNLLVYVPDFFRNTSLEMLDVSYSRNLHYLPFELDTLNRPVCIKVHPKDKIVRLQARILQDLNKHLYFYSDTASELYTFFYRLTMLDYQVAIKNIDHEKLLVRLDAMPNQPALTYVRSQGKLTVYYDAALQNKAAEISYGMHNEPDGAFYLYYPDGKLMQKREYSKGKPADRWVTYDIYGDPLSEIGFTYVQGKQKIKYYYLTR